MFPVSKTFDLINFPDPSHLFLHISYWGCFSLLPIARRAGMWMHADNAEVCHAALAALANVCAYGDTNVVLEITSCDLDAVVNAMRAHQNVQKVQQNAFIVLKNLSLCRANIMVMERNPLLVPLIRMARSTWGSSFQGADDLLRVLPASN